MEQVRKRELAQAIVDLNGSLEVRETGKPTRAVWDYAPELAALVLEEPTDLARAIVGAIHIDVRSAPEMGDLTYIVQVRTDGAGWKTIVICDEDTPERSRDSAEWNARQWAEAIEYATGIRPRTTSCGYGL